MAAIQEEEEGALDPFLSCRSRKKRAISWVSRRGRGWDMGASEFVDSWPRGGIAFCSGLGAGIARFGGSSILLFLYRAGDMKLPFMAGCSIALVGSRSPH